MMRGPRRFLQSALIVFVFVTSLHAENNTTRETLLKGVAESQRFNATGTSAQYDESTIETLDPAAGATLKLYGLRGATVQEWTAATGKVQAMLFEMTNSGAAYGYYALQRSSKGGDPTPVLIGADSFRRGNQLYFWQSNYAVRIDGPAALQTDLALLLSRGILGRSQKPPVASYLPLTNIVAGTERYLIDAGGIPGAAGLDSSQLGFDSSAEAAIAEYRVNGTQAQLLLLLYPTQHIAKKYTDALPGGSAAFRKRDGPLFALVYGTNDEASAAAILDGVNHEFQVTWDEEKPGLGLGPIIVAVATFVGIVLAFTTIIGLGYGGLRIFMKNRLPGGPFDKTAGPGMIQLKLIQEVTDKPTDDVKRVDSV
jgi:hypothetical protein